MAQDNSPVWFITGCSTGFGRDLTTEVLKKGHRVVITARKPEQAADLAKGHEANTLVLPLDVTKPEQIKDAVVKATEKFGRIDVLVNNAGYGYLAAIEEGEDGPVREMFETNFFGLLEVTKAVLPGMRQRKKGHIVNFSSVAGQLSFPASGYYSATKHAVEAVSEALSQEVEPLGIKVMIVEPGPFRTKFAGSSIKQSKIRIADYEATAGKRREELAARDGKQPGDPVRAALAVIKAVEDKNTPLRLLLGKPGMEMVYKKLDTLKANFEAWKDTTLGADYPEEAQKKAG